MLEHVDELCPGPGLTQELGREQPRSSEAEEPVEEIHHKFEESEDNIKIDIQPLPDETPEREDPSHCGFLMDIDKDESVIAGLLAQVACKMEPARSI